MLSANVPPEVIQDQSLFYPYAVKDGETPTIVAYNYYGDIGYVWLIAIANQIVDFTSQWPKSQPDFDAYIISKYGSQGNAQSTIAYYRHKTDSTYPKVTPISYAAFNNDKKAFFNAVSVFDDEWLQNDAKRSIRLIDKSLASRLLFEMNTLLNQ